MKVSLLTEDTETEETDDSATNEDLEKLRDSQISAILAENGLTMYDFVNYKDDIADSVLAQIQKVLDEYDNKMDVVMANQGVNGTDGKDGATGKMGATGATGAKGATGTTGATGKTGTTGKTGATGATGAVGKTGATGADGKSTYIAYATSESGSGFSLEPTTSTKYIGTCITTSTTQPTTASSYTWKLYRELIMTYDDSTNTLTIQ